MIKRMPAYSRHLCAALKAGKEPLHGIGIYIDRTPPECSIYAPLAVFSDTDPADVDWSICSGRDVIVPRADEADRDRLLATVAAIRAARPRRLLLLKAEPPGFEFVVTAGRAGT